MISIRRRPALARILLLLSLVVIGMMFRPVLDIATEVHLAGHGISLIAYDAAPAEPGLSAAHAELDREMERAHGGLHQDGSTVAVADLSVELIVPVLLFARESLSPAPVVDVPSGHPADVFRPPIA